jgi:hypothetical protein
MTSWDIQVYSLVQYLATDVKEEEEEDDEV